MKSKVKSIRSLKSRVKSSRSLKSRVKSSRRLKSKNKSSRSLKTKVKSRRSLKPRVKSTRSLKSKVKSNFISYENNILYSTTRQYDKHIKKNYIKNLKKINDAIEFTSGKHSINIELSDLWVNSQLTDLRKQVARDLLNNTYYVTIENISNSIERQLLILYNNVDYDIINKNVYIYTTMWSDASNYYLTILILSFIRKHGFNEPTCIMDINSIIQENAVLIVPDDVSYSGSQLSKYLDTIKIFRREQELHPDFEHIYVLLAGANRYSLSKLHKPNVTVLCDVVYPLLIDSIGLERYMYIKMFFSPWTMNQPLCSIYLDNKIADEFSTFKKVLMFGPIIPYDYNFNRYLNPLSLSIQMYRNLSELYLIEKPILTNNLLIEFINNNPEYITFKNRWNFSNFGLDPEDCKSVDILENIVITLYIQEKITIQENNVVSSSNNQNRFIPFINNCRNNSDIRRLITDSDIISLPYTYFLIPFNCVLPDNSKKKCSVPEHIYIDDFTNSRTKDKIKRVQNKIESLMCPNPWYKSGPFEMV